MKTAPAPNVAWFCVHTQPKHEHIAACHLQKLVGVKIFLPRIRFRRATRRGVVWTTEALFPRYLFAQLDWKKNLRQVHHSPGVKGIVHFGEHWPAIPDTAVNELRAAFGPQALRLVPPQMRPGDVVKIAGGVFRGLPAVITQILPARERVTVLLDFLGRQTAMEVPRSFLVRQAGERECLWQPAPS